MKILVTGAKGFLAKNLIAELRNRQYNDIYEYDLGMDPSLLDEYCRDADFFFHLAGVTRPKEQAEFMESNFGFTSKLLEALKRQQNTCPVLYSSSIQAVLENPYGWSKKAGEELLFSYAAETGTEVLIYRFPNIFGKWCRPNYNSVVATFCYNIANDIPIQVNDPDIILSLSYIDDVADELIKALSGDCHREGEYCGVPVVYHEKLGRIAELIRSFREDRKDLHIPDMSDGFTKKLYSTYLSYLPTDQFNCPLATHEDHRGSFTEFMKTPDRGQLSVNISKPGVIKGNHWHQTKNEKFLVVSGKGVIRFRKLDEDSVIEYHVCGEKLEAVDIPPGYTHHIENLGETDLITIIWANELFQPENPDTYYLEV